MSFTNYEARYLMLLDNDTLTKLQGFMGKRGNNIPVCRNGKHPMIKLLYSFPLSADVLITMEYVEATSVEAFRI